MIVRVDRLITSFEEHELLGTRRLSGSEVFSIAAAQEAIAECTDAEDPLFATWVRRHYPRLWSAYHL
jgi:hypothetical protein